MTALEAGVEEALLSIELTPELLVDDVSVALIPAVD